MKAKTKMQPSHTAFARAMSFVLSVLMVAGVFGVADVGSLETNAATSNNWSWPTSVQSIKSDWPTYSSGSYHGGTDFPVALNSPVYSTCDGEVVAVTSLTTSYGKHIKIKAVVNGSVVYMRYCHLNSFVVSVGDKVKSGQLIAYSGSTGNSTGPHLHYEVRNSQDTYGSVSSPNLNPKNYLPGSSYSFETNNPIPSAADIGTDFYAYIINKSAWKMATVNTSNNNVELQSETGFRNQLWYFERQSDKSYKITNVATGKCLDVNNAGTTNGENVKVWDDNSSNAQRWYFIGSGDYEMHPKCATNMSMDVSDGSTNDGANIQIWETNGTAAQTFTVWKFENKPNKPTVTSSSKTYTVGSNVKVLWGENAFATSYFVEIWYTGWSEKTSFVTTDTSYTLNDVKEGKYGVKVTSRNENGITASEIYNFYVPYTISYDMNGGSGSIASQTKVYGQDLTLSNTKPTRTGYTFLGWSTSASATTATYQPGGKYTANSGATLYAVWKAKQLKVTFYRNTSSSDTTTASQTFTYDVSNQSFSNKNWSKAGYTLIGWSHDKNATTATYGVLSPLSNGWINQYSPSCNLYAVWKANTYTVTFNANGGDCSTTTQSVTYNKSYGTLPAPTRLGYVFDGWYTSVDSNVQVTSTSIFNQSSNQTLYAHWLAYSVVSVNTRVMETNTPINISWTSVKNAKSYILTVYKNAEKITEKTNLTGTNTTMSFSEPGRYSFVITTVGTSAKSYSQAIYVAVYDYATLSDDFIAEIENIDVGKLVTNDMNKVTSRTSTGSENQIWHFEKYDDGSYSIQSMSDNRYLSAGTNNGSWIYLSDELEVKWYIYQTDTGYILKPNNSTSCVFDLSYSSHDDASQEGTTYIIYNYGNVQAETFTINKVTEIPSKSLVTSDKTKYNANDNAIISWDKAKYATSYYVEIWYTGWSEKTSFVTTDTSYTLNDVKEGKYGVKVTSRNENGITASEIYNFYVPYTISYDMNGGSGSIASQTKTYGKDLTLSSTKPTRTGYTFLGWGTSASATTATYQPSGKYTANQNATLYAVWEEVLINNSIISATSITKGTEIVMTGRAVGGTGSYQYAMLARHENSSSWTVLKNYNTTSTKKWTPAKTGTYKVAIKVKDSSGKVVEKLFTVTVKSALTNNSAISDASITKGTEITLTGKASGGTAPYKFQMVAKHENDTKWTVLKDYSTTSTKKWTPAKTGTYKVAIKVKDSSGKVVEKIFTVTVNPAALANASTVSATSITKGTEIVMTGKASGGTAPYKFQMVAKHKNDTKWTVLKDYSTTSTKKWTPAKTGTYKVAIKVKDSSGKVVEKLFTIRVE